MKASLARFYGWTNEEICRLPLSVAQDYYIAHRVLTDRETASLAVAGSISSMKKDARDKYFKGLNKSTKLVIENDGGKVLSVEDAAKTLGRAMMNG